MGACMDAAWLSRAVEQSGADARKKDLMAAMASGGLPFPYPSSCGGLAARSTDETRSFTAWGLSPSDGCWAGSEGWGPKEERRKFGQSWACKRRRQQARAPAACTGGMGWIAWKDGMLAQGRVTLPCRRPWPPGQGTGVRPAGHSVVAVVPIEGVRQVRVKRDDIYVLRAPSVRAGGARLNPDSSTQ